MSTELKKILSYPANDINKILQNGVYSVGTESEREALTLTIKTTNRTVFVRESGKTYSWNGSSWDELASGGGSNIPTEISRYVNKIYIEMSNASSLSGTLTLPIVTATNFIVDWGDDSEMTEYMSSTSTISHKYTNSSFKGIITIYGDWLGIKFNSSTNDNKKVIVGIEYDYNITSIPEYGLYGCGYLKSLKTSGGSLLLYKYALYNTSFLESVNWPEGSVYFRENSMQRSGIKNPILIDINSNVAGSSYAFSYCDELTKVIFLENGFSGVQIASYMFQNCRKLREVELCRNIERINAGAFSSCDQLTELTIPEDGYYTPTLTIDSQAMPNVKKLIIKKRSSLAILSNINALTNAELIFVPSTLLGDYKTATNWLNFADRIYPIGDRKSVV